MKDLPQIYFYISRYDRIDKNIKERNDVYYSNLHEYGINDGEYAWTLQTYLYLI